MDNNNMNKIVEKVKGRWIPKNNDNLGNFLFELVKQKGPLTRPDLVKLTNIPTTTIYDYLIDFIRTNKMVKYPVSSRKRGRPHIFYKIP
jgi:predicted transcriptional regulator